MSAATSGPRRLLGASDSSAATSSAASFTTGEMASLRVIGRKMQKRCVRVPIRPAWRAPNIITIIYKDWAVAAQARR